MWSPLFQVVVVLCGGYVGCDDTRIHDNTYAAKGGGEGLGTDSRSEVSRPTGLPRGGAHLGVPPSRGQRRRTLDAGVVGRQQWDTAADAFFDHGRFDRPRGAAPGRGIRDDDVEELRVLVADLGA